MSLWDVDESPVPEFTRVDVTLDEGRWFYSSHSPVIVPRSGPVAGLWPGEDWDQCVEWLNEWGWTNHPAVTHSGIECLMHRLYKYRDDPKRQLATLVVASIHERQRSRESYALGRLFLRVQMELHKMGIFESFHHRQRSMPSSVLDADVADLIAKYGKTTEAVIALAKADWERSLKWRSHVPVAVHNLAFP